jgi:two-component system sensor histidine kinase KdpD
VDSQKAKHLSGNFLKALFIFISASGCSVLVSMVGVGNESIIMVFLLGVLFTTVMTSSYLWGIVASFGSLMLFNYLFTEPRYTLHIYSSRDIMLLGFFLVTAVVSGGVTTQLQKEIALAAKNESTARRLYKIASGFLSVSGQKSIVLRGLSYIKEYTGSECVVRLDNGEAYQNQEPPQDAFCREYGIHSAAGSLGVLQVYTGTEKIDDQAELTIQAVATQMGITLDREQLYNQQEHIRLVMEKERLRATLLRSVAHDLRSPLTALSGAGNLLADNYDNLNEQERRKLAADISEEIIWLSDLVENILNMTRINESQLVLQKSEEVVDDVVSEAISHMNKFMKERKFTVSLPDDVIMVPMDGRLIVRVLINLLENAVRHTAGDAEIRLDAAVRGSMLEVVVSDTGYGVDDRIKDSLFNQFVTFEKAVTDGRKGIGLGLTICKAIVEAHGGSIRAEANVPRGARFIFTLPMEG